MIILCYTTHLIQVGFEHPHSIPVVWEQSRSSLHSSKGAGGKGATVNASATRDKLDTTDIKGVCSFEWRSMWLHIQAGHNK